MTEHELEVLFKKQDWYYHMADDHSAFGKGQRAYQKLIAALGQYPDQPAAVALWAKYAPSHVRYPIRRND